MHEEVPITESVTGTMRCNVGLAETVPWPHATAHITHRNAAGEVLWEGDATNVITNAGRDFMHLQAYGTSGLGANGLNYVAVSNDALSETTASTTLSNEIAANGLTRAQGTVAHSAGTNVTTVTKTFTCATAPQSAQKAALFSASSTGTMNHVLAFTQRALQIGDQLTVAFTITVG